MVRPSGLRNSLGPRLFLVACLALLSVRCGGDGASITVPEDPFIGLSETIKSFSGTEGAAAPASQTVAITNEGDGTLSGLVTGVSYTSGQAEGWLTAELSSTSAPSTMTLTATTGSLAPGSYTASVAVSSDEAGNSPQAVGVNFTVQPGAAAATIVLSSTSQNFTSLQGGASPAAQTLDVSNGGEGTIDGLTADVTYPSDQPGGWLTAGLSGTAAPSILTLTAATGSLAAGTYTASVAVGSTSAENSPQRVEVSFTVAPPTAGPIISLSTHRRSFTATQGLGNTPPQTLEVTNGGGGTLTGLTAEVTYAEPPTGWLSAILSRTDAPATLTLTIAATSLHVGSYEAEVAVQSSVAENSPQQVTVALTVVRPATPQAPSNLTATAVSASQINLTWTDNSSEEAYFLIAGGVGGDLEHNTVPANVTTYQSTNLAPGTTYSYRVRAYNSGGDSDWSNTAAATTPPGPPTKLAFRVQPSRVHGNEPITPGVEVVIQDEAGNTVTTSTDEISILLDNDEEGGTLSGQVTVAAVDGIALFSGITVDRPGQYTLAANSGSLRPVISESFEVYLSFVEISVGRSHTCTVTRFGSAYCWGENQFGQLGDGTITHRNTPVLVTGGIRFATVSAGRSHNCAVTTANLTYCWGWNANGQLGDGTTTNRRIPTEVIGGHTFKLVEAAGQHTCAIATGGAAFCWGTDGFGHLGDGDPIGASAVTSPVAVAGGLTFTSLSSGHHHTCGATTDNRMFCWGDNTYGMLGEGTTNDRSAPTEVLGGHSFREVGAGVLHSCGITTDFLTYCWGYNFFGQLGDGTTTNRLVPTAVTPNFDFNFVSDGGSHSCAISRRLAYCWGWNDSWGQLGDGTSIDRLSPTLLPKTWSVLSGRDFHTCGIDVANEAYCWGRNDRGQLGDGTVINRNLPTRVVQ